MAAKISNMSYFIILYPSFCPIVSIEVAIADSFSYVLALHFLRACEVGYGAGHLEYA